MTQPVPAAPAQPQPQQAAPPRRVQQKGPGVPDLVAEMQDWFVSLQRSVSGYNALHLSLLSFQGQLPEGERKKGLPILSFKAPAPNGKDAIEVVADLKKVQPEYIPHVLVPLINAQAGDMLESLEEIATRVDMLKQMLGGLVAPQSQQPQAAV